MAPCDGATAGLDTALPIVHVILLEGAGGTENTCPGEPDRLLDLRGCSLVGIDPGPDFGLFGPARMPHAEGPRSRPQHREVGKDRADDRLHATKARAETRRHFRQDPALVFKDL